MLGLSTDVKLNTPAPGSKSIVFLNIPVVITLPEGSTFVARGVTNPPAFPICFTQVNDGVCAFAISPDNNIADISNSFFILIFLEVIAQR